MTKAAALEAKNKGNTAFKKGEYEAALTFYSEAMILDPQDQVYPSNRAMTNLKLERWADAEEDCNKALALTAQNVKALWRRGIARKNLGKLVEARQDWELALKIEPGNSTIMDELKQLEWLEKKAKRATRGIRPSRLANVENNPTHEASDASYASLDARVTPERIRIPVKEVDELPAELLDVPQASTQPDLPTKPEQVKTATAELTSIEQPAAVPAQEEPKIGTSSIASPPSQTPKISASSSVVPPSQASLDLAMYGISPGSLPTVSALLQLLRTPVASNPGAAEYLFSIPSEKLPTIFGRAGLETSHLEGFLDAVLVCKSVGYEDWRRKALSVLQVLPIVGRFSIASMFVGRDKVQKVFAALAEEATAEEEEHSKKAGASWGI
ncbi:hypothetical protein G7K_0127-t1 [Saitoella complicata NRRL Y-17804]|uniref:RNA polymerase II-associated protein 3 n=1 Tax=Saitoella complicata (strain BCRC 22490 / CBS 7301 / JCM 7358 / NBRC 10748 / NRRL Y-17804) TaxID=698492 RepID=A0A0E9N860_SAICN|nr:hypothetical protein G7K_0127-t1 [Saitoella complicata NRRL Y-17804]